MKRDIYEEATLLGDLIKMELEKDGRENVIPALDVVPSAIHLKMIVDEVTEIAKGETLDGISNSGRDQGYYFGAAQPVGKRERRWQNRQTTFWD